MATGLGGGLGPPGDSEQWNRLAQVAHNAAFREGLQNEADLADLVEDVMVFLLVNGPNRPNLEAFVAGVARNYARSAKRRWAIAQKRLADGTDLDQLAHEGVLDPVDRFIAQESVLQVRLLLAELPERQRQAIELFYIDKHSRKTVAELMQVTEETIKTHLERGMAALRRKLDVSEPRKEVE